MPDESWKEWSDRHLGRICNQKTAGQPSRVDLLVEQVVRYPL